MYIVYVHCIIVAQHSSVELEVGSMIQFGNPMKYGVIKRMERANGTSKGLAEVEMVSCIHEYSIYSRF